MEMKGYSPAFVQTVQDKHPNQNSDIIDIFEPDAVKSCVKLSSASLHTLTPRF